MTSAWRFILCVSLYVVLTSATCPLQPSSSLTSAARTPGDGGYKIITSGRDQKYIPNTIYAISLRGKLI